MIHRLMMATLVAGLTGTAPAQTTCYCDFTGDYKIDFFDFLNFQNTFAAGGLGADCDGSGSLDFFDFVCFQDCFAAGCAFDVAITGLRAEEGVGCGDSAWVDVTLRNTGEYDIVTDVGVNIGTHSAVKRDVLVPAGPDPIVARVIVPSTPIPPGPTSCGGAEPFGVTACAEVDDDNPDNNCFAETIGLVGCYWDIQLEIRDEPATILACGPLPVQWTVRVSNAGNARSDNVCLITGIVAGRGPGVWLPTPYTVQLWSGRIEPGKFRDIPVSYPVCGLLCPRTQWIKAEVHYAAGCSDICEQGNFTEESVRVNCF
jgi:hypothetical protein